MSRNVAYALVRAASRLFSTPSSLRNPCVEKCLDVARTSAYATWYKGLMKVFTRTSSLLAMGLVLGATAIQAADPAPSGIRAQFLSQLADVEKKMNSLAVAMPADK